MRAQLTALIMCLALMTPQGAAADPVVVELYTSQGCSSCPPADALLGELAKHEDVIALALHVDYWDFIGWPDTFADPAFGARQKAYARLVGARSVFTPHLVVGGVDHIAGPKGMELMQKVRAHSEARTGVRLSLVSGGAEALVDGATDAPFARPLDLVLVGYLESETVDIEHGENAGKRIEYTHVVRQWQPLGTWTGRAPLSLRVPGSAPGLRRVLLAQEPGPGAILAALRLD